MKPIQSPQGNDKAGGTERLRPRRGCGGTGRALPAPL